MTSSGSSLKRFLDRSEREAERVPCSIRKSVHIRRHYTLTVVFTITVIYIGINDLTFFEGRLFCTNFNALYFQKLTVVYYTASPRDIFVLVMKSRCRNVLSKEREICVSRRARLCQRRNESIFINGDCTTCNLNFGQNLQELGRGSPGRRLDRAVGAVGAVVQCSKCNLRR